MPNTPLSADEIQSKTINWLRFPLAVAVVLIHISPKIDTQSINYSSLSSDDLYALFASLFSHVITYIAVPCFFLFSGFLFFFKVNRFTRELYFKKLRVRALTLLVPYLLWNLLPILSNTAIKSFLHSKWMEVLSFISNN